jgi:hypothetical protein
LLNDEIHDVITHRQKHALASANLYKENRQPTTQDLPLNKTFDSLLKPNGCSPLRERKETTAN